jgi:hypothetical protein
LGRFLSEKVGFWPEECMASRSLPKGLKCTTGGISKDKIMPVILDPKFMIKGDVAADLPAGKSYFTIFKEYCFEYELKKTDDVLVNTSREISIHPNNGNIYCKFSKSDNGWVLSDFYVSVE